MSVCRYAIMNDIHFPFEDRLRYPLALEIIKSVDPEHIYLNGDIGEFLSVGTHPTHPADQQKLKDELIYLMGATPQWQTGFALVTSEGKSSFSHEIIEIKNNRAFVHGKLFKG